MEIKRAFTYLSVATFICLFYAALFYFVFKDTPKSEPNVQGVISTATTTSNSTISDYKFSPQDLAKFEQAELIKVSDGDTLSVKVNGEKETLRLIGIDTPETQDPRKPVQCFGKEATAELKRLLTGHSLYVKADPTQDNLDKYGRSLRYLALEDGTFVNYELVRNGFAHEYTYRVPYQYRDLFIGAANKAREENLGLYGSC
jgi:micrococcal nuclease